MAHLPPGMEFPNGWMTIDTLLIAFLMIDFVFLMVIIGATIWLESRRAPDERRARRDAPRARATLHHGGSGPHVADHRAIRQGA
jgi:hypothetical protein